MKHHGNTDRTLPESWNCSLCQTESPIRQIKTKNLYWYSLCVQRFCSQTARLYSGVNEKVIQFSIFYKTHQGIRMKCFILKVEIFSRRNSKLQWNAWQVIPFKIWITVLGAQCFMQNKIGGWILCKCRTSWQTFDGIRMTQLYLGYFLEKLVLASSHYFLQWSQTSRHFSF